MSALQKNDLLGSIIPPSVGTERLLKLQLQTSARLVSLISAYAPTLTSASELKDRFLPHFGLLEAS